MKTRVAIYGGTELSAAEAKFVEALTYALLQTGNIIVITGGFLSGKKSPGDISTDHSILEGARKYSTQTNIALKDCLETWLPDPDAEQDPEKKEVVRFREGSVKELDGESAQARRFSMVKDVDALITVKGKKHTAMVLDFALTINKPAFPLGFTGGDSANYWNSHKDRIKQWFGIDDDLERRLGIGKIEELTFPARDALIERIKGAVIVGVRKELSNDRKYRESEDDRAFNSEGISSPAPDRKDNIHPKTLKVFLSYAHKDLALKDQLDSHLYALKRSKRISIWTDREIRGGDDWNESIRQELGNADVILLLISKNFISSIYIWENELNVAIARHEKGLARVIPVFLNYVDVEDTPYARLQGFLDPEHPVTSYRNRDKAFKKIMKEFREDVLKT